MRKLIGHTANTESLSGRRRLVNDDIEVLQSQFSEGFEKLFKGKGSFVISGGAISGTTGAYAIAPALVYLNGKVISFEGVTNYAIVTGTKLVEDAAELTGERAFDAISEDRAGIIKYKCKLTEATAQGDAIPLNIYGFERTYESVLADSLYPAIYKKASINILPIGAISMWAGSLEKFDNTGKGKGELDGWALCNGANNTPDMRGRFVVGLDPLVTEYNEPNKTGGVKEVRLTIDQLPKHRHTSDIAQGVGGLIKQSQSGQPKTAVSADSSGAGTEPNILDAPINDNVVGADAAHENRPPYFVVCYIQKIAIANVVAGIIVPPPPPPNPCNLTDGQKLGVWTITGQDLITKYFNGKFWVFQVSSYSPLQLVPRGRNMLLRSDVTPVNSLPLQTCFAAEDTLVNGLAYPSSFVTPTGWETFTIGDTTLIRQTGTGGGGGGGGGIGNGIDEAITFNVTVI